MDFRSTDIQLFLSNRLEDLADRLIRELALQRKSPLDMDTVVVQSRGMARWLNLRMAEKLGIQMNTRYLYPRAMIEHLLAGLIPDYDSLNHFKFSTNGLFWSIYKSLPGWSSQPQAGILKDYLKSDSLPNGFLRRYQLAMKLSSYIDQLQIYRPDLISNWEKNKPGNNWNSFIWRALTSEPNPPSLPSLLSCGRILIDEDVDRPDSWPDNLHIFGVSSLPPQIVGFLKSASQWIPISLYLTQPSPLFWGDQPSKKKQIKSQPELSQPEGHGLLGSLGKQGQDFLNTLIDSEIFTNDQSELFRPPVNTSLLTELQNDLYWVNAPPLNKKEVKVPEGIKVCVCHSPKREIEVLKDELLRRFQKDPYLTPDQIIIMAPDIEVYAPAIHSIFGSLDYSSKDYIPYSIADHSTRSSSTVAYGILSLLDLLESRFTASEVINFLSIPFISLRFGFQQQDWMVIRDWIQETNIRWGIDAEHRKQSSGASFDEYSWSRGIDQLIAGYCIHPDSVSHWDSIKPHPNIEGNAAASLNRLLDAWQFIRQYQPLASEILTVSQWLQSIGEMVEFLFRSLDSLEEECQSIIQMIADIKRESKQANCDEPMSLKVVRAIFLDRLSGDYQAGSFFSGTITFCSLRPMRNIPAKFVGLIGMNENAFPRQEYGTEFTQFPDGRRPGDRSTRDDDRYLFLESILAARDRFYISYTGIDNQTLAEKPASIVVEELLDTMEDYYRIAGQSSIRAVVYSRETLQAFSPVQFQCPDPRSFSSENLEAAKALTGKPKEYGTFQIGSVHLAVESPVSLPLRFLQQFFKNPCRYWLNQQLDLGFPFLENSFEDSEPLESDNLSQYHWGELLLRHPEILAGKNEYLLRESMPVGALREVAFQKVLPEVEKMAAQLSLLSHEDKATAHFDIQLPAMAIQGAIRGVTENSFIKVRYGRIRGFDFLATWLEHLCLCIQSGNESFTTHFLAKEDSFSFQYTVNAFNQLSELTELFREGQQRAIPLFLETAFLFSKEKVLPNRSRTSPAEKALKEFSKGNDTAFGMEGEGSDPYIRMCYPDSEIILSPEFENHALRAFQSPLLNAKGYLNARS